MVFSFFKKDKQPEQQPKKPKAVSPSAPKVAVPPAHLADETREDEGGGYSVIEVSYADEDTSAETHSVVEEVAILYANERVGEATNALVQYLKESTDIADLQPWLLLFELYQLQGLRQQFEELSLDFVVKMERSAPMWEEQRVTTCQQTKVVAPQGGSGVVAVKGTLTGTCEAERNKLMELAATPTGVKLDLTEVEGANTTGCGRMGETLNQIRKNGGRLSVIGADVLIGALSKAVAVRKDEESKNYWRLLRELYQYLGRQEDFEELAIQYAVTFEESPPSWEAVPLPAADVGSSDEEQTTSRGDVYVFEGVINMASEPQFKLIKDFAESRSNIVIDLSQVPRVDFATVGLFISMLIGLSQAGKTVVITGANQLVQALFEIMGVKEFATVKRH